MDSFSQVFHLNICTSDCFCPNVFILSCKVEDRGPECANNRLCQLVNAFHFYLLTPHLLYTNHVLFGACRSICSHFAFGKIALH